MSVAWNNGVFSPTYPGEVNPESGTIDEIAAAERRGYNRAISVLRAVNWGDAADYLAKHPDPAPKEPTP